MSSHGNSSDSVYELALRSVSPTTRTSIWFEVRRGSGHGDDGHAGRRVQPSSVMPSPWKRHRRSRPLPGGVVDEACACTPCPAGTVARNQSWSCGQMRPSAWVLVLSSVGWLAESLGSRHVVVARRAARLEEGDVVGLERVDGADHHEVGGRHGRDVAHQQAAPGERAAGGVLHHGGEVVLGERVGVDVDAQQVSAGQRDGVPVDVTRAEGEVAVRPGRDAERLGVVVVGLVAIGLAVAGDAPAAGSRRSAGCSRSCRRWRTRGPWAGRRRSAPGTPAAPSSRGRCSSGCPRSSCPQRRR